MLVVETVFSSRRRRREQVARVIDAVAREPFPPRKTVAPVIAWCFVFVNVRSAALCSFCERRRSRLRAYVSFL
jgi:hypothetical protein